MYTLLARYTPASNNSHDLNGFQILSDYEMLDYELTKRDEYRLQTFIEAAIKAGKLTKGL